MSRFETTLRPQPRLDLKWLKTDLQSVLTEGDSLINCWNSLIADGELTGAFSDGLLNSAGVTARKGEFGKYYCNQKVLTCTCCDGICGPSTGCNCQPCQKLDAEDTQKEVKEPIPSTEALLGQWAWIPQPSNSNLKILFLYKNIFVFISAFEQLSQFVLSLNNEQKLLCADAASSTLAATRLHYRLIILKRYFIALNRVPHCVDFEHGLVTSRKVNSELLQTRNLVKSKCKPSYLDPALALARVGSRAALNFAFAFLRKAWRLGNCQFCILFLFYFGNF